LARPENHGAHGIVAFGLSECVLTSILHARHSERSNPVRRHDSGLLRRFAPRNDEMKQRSRDARAPEFCRYDAQEAEPEPVMRRRWWIPAAFFDQVWQFVARMSASDMREMPIPDIASLIRATRR
jgi:hypothetical protein